MAIDSPTTVAEPFTHHPFHHHPQPLQSGHPVSTSYQKWMSQTIYEEEAAQKIQVFVRDKLQLHASASISIQETTSTTSSSPPEDENSQHMQYEVILWHGSALGLQFASCEMTGYPRVVDADGNESLPGMWSLREGDFLLAINDYSTNRSVMAFDSVIHILEDGARPAVLRFRRPGCNEIHPSATRPRRLSIARQERQRRRERLERSLSYVVWREEDGPLGIGLKPHKEKPYPSVYNIKENGFIASGSSQNKVSVGDLLLSINHFDVHQLGFKKTLQVMQFAPKPLVLTFRRTASDTSQPRSIDL